jgi:hypothetical protein
MLVNVCGLINSQHLHLTRGEPFDLTYLSFQFRHWRCPLWRSGGKALAMIEVANILLCVLHLEVMRCTAHLQTHFCTIRDDPSWTIRDARMPFQDTAMPDGDAFRVLLAEMAASAMS